jgi:hypothetical protein
LQQPLVRFCIEGAIGEVLIFIFLTLAHYSRYFKSAEGSDPGEHEIIFDWAALREACISFLDSIIIELCFPRAPYPKTVLYQILREAVDESPKEAKRFPQALWDAVSDLSASSPLASAQFLTYLFRIQSDFKNYWKHHYLVLKPKFGKTLPALKYLILMKLGWMLKSTLRRRQRNMLILKTLFSPLKRQKTKLFSRICGNMSTL